MATNLFYCYPHLPVSATITTSAAYSGYSIDNTIAGARHLHYKRSAVATSTDVDFDLGVGVTAQPEYFLVARADFVKRGDSASPTLTMYADDNSSFTTPENQALTLDANKLYNTYSEDTIKETTFTTAYRYFRLRFATTESIFHEFSKIYFGSFFDFGIDPTYISNYKLDKKKQDERKTRRVFTLVYEGITEAKRVSFINTIENFADTYPIFLYDKNDYVLHGKKLLHCWVSNAKWQIGYFNNKLSLELTEIY